MRRFQRGPEPQVLTDGAPQWTTRLLARRAADPTSRFQWPQVALRGLNEHLLEALGPLTDRRCAYCDGDGLGAQSRETIDHFRPSSRFPECAFEWGNLYLACDVCQAEKLDQFEETLLRPDAVDFEFQRYFTFNFLTGDIEPNLGASEGDQARARDTIRLFGLNARARPTSRLRELRRFRGQADRVVADFAYRFVLELAVS